jgi:hypothetical protein
MKGCSMSPQKISWFLYRPFIFIVFLFATQGFSQIGFHYSLIGTAALAAYSDGTPYCSTMVNSIQYATLKGKKPSSGERIMLYSYFRIADPNGDFVCKIDKTNLKDVAAGIFRTHVKRPFYV